MRVTVQMETQQGTLQPFMRFSQKIISVINNIIFKMFVEQTAILIWNEVRAKWSDTPDG